MFASGHLLQNSLLSQNLSGSKITNYDAFANSPFKGHSRLSFAMRTTVQLPELYAFAFFCVQSFSSWLNITRSTFKINWILRSEDYVNKRMVEQPSKALFCGRSDRMNILWLSVRRFGIDLCGTTQVAILDELTSVADRVEIWSRVSTTWTQIGILGHLQIVGSEASKLRIWRWRF